MSWMAPQSESTTWRILPMNGGHFQWVAANGDQGFHSDSNLKTLASDADISIRSRLPSMADLLLQAHRNTLLPNKTSSHDQHAAFPPSTGCVRGDNGGGGAIFSTGSGRTISVQPSSVQKARSLLGEENVVDKVSYGSEVTPMFRTGLGESVHVKQPSIKIAEALLEATSDKEDAFQNHSVPEVRDFRSTCPPVKFQTAGGRSISISTGALKRAKSLFNDSELEALEGEAKANALSYSNFENEKVYNNPSCNIRRDSLDNFCEGSFMNKGTSSAKQFYSPLMVPIIHNELSIQVDSKISHHSSSNDFCSKPPNKDVLTALRKVPCSSKIQSNSSAGRALVDISNYTGSNFVNKGGLYGEKKRPGKESTSSAFKKPRTTRFIAPLNNNSSSLVETEAALPSTSVNCCSRPRVSLHYPFQVRRKELKEFFGPPRQFSTFENIPARVRYITADNAENYKFHYTSAFIDYGLKAFQEMLLHSGALLADTSERWVANHYKWIVWKLACLERCYPYEAMDKLLTVSNVLEELKYRYEREVNYGHRSALKKILDGDVSSSSMMILCVSAIRSYSATMTDELPVLSDVNEDGKKLTSVGSDHVMKIELTDGWYSLNATLDVHLSKQLISGKLFVGQKLRIWGASLCGWVEPISPLEASNTVNLVLNINGTYRARWDDSLGFCKVPGAPLAFTCIKGGGGKVPKTLVGVMRLYPILYKERLPVGGSIVRSENMEKKILQLYSRKRRDVVEDILSELEDAPVSVNDSDDGAKLLKILEKSDEPEVLMAGMSLEQLASFSSYQAKQEALRQANLHKKIEKALEDAGLGSRDVTPFMRARVIGLTGIDSSRKGRPREGLITIWNPTEKQKLDLVEGQIYSVSWLVPFRSNSDFLYLQSRGPSSEWIRLSISYSKGFESFFIPRKSVFLSNLGEVSLASEFDTAAVVVYVGEAYVSGIQRKQWIFVADGSGCNCSSLTENEHDCMLAISFCSPISNYSLEPISRCLSGNTVGFCNLIKRARDRNNHLWVAEATENSTYVTSYNISSGSHLKVATELANKWAKTSSTALEKLKERVLSITHAHEI